jgi:hypothetical protein
VKGYYWTHRRIDILKNLHGLQEWSTFVQALALALLLPLLLRLKLPTLMGWLEPGSAVRVMGSSPERLGQVVLWALEFARPLVRSGCLVRGLTLYGLLRRAGVEVSLCFGIAPWKQGFTGHCWLTLEGRPFLEPEGAGLEFSPVLQFPRKEVSLAE